MRFIQATESSPREYLNDLAAWELLAFTRDTGHRHPDLRQEFANYRELLARSRDADQVAERLASLGAEAGLDETNWQGLLAELRGRAD